MKPGLVSIVVSFYNELDFLADAIESVLAQTYTNWELLLADDGSTDGSSEIAAAYQAAHPGKIFHLEHQGHANRGTAASRNLGICQARGEYIAILDADDFWMPQKLERQVKILTEHPSAGMVFGTPLYWYSWTGKNRDIVLDCIPDVGLPFHQVIPAPSLLTAAYPLGSGGAPCPCDIMLRSAVISGFDGFEESFTGIYQMYEDQVFLAKVYSRTGVFIANECWSWYRQRPNSCVRQVRKAGQYAEVRMRYLKWLEQYLQAQGLYTADLQRAIARAYWWHEHPTLTRIQHLQQRIRYYFQRWNRPKQDLAAALRNWRPARPPQAVGVDR